MCISCNPGLANACQWMFKGVDIAKAIEETTPQKIAESSRLGISDGPRAVVFHNGTIRVMTDPNAPIPDALAIKDGKIVYIGSLADAQAAAGTEAKTHDLQNGCLLPGFIEPHLHLVLTAMASKFFYDFSVNDGGITTQDLAVEKIQSHISEPNAGSWFLGYGYDPSRVADNLELPIELLDRMSSIVPIYIINQSGHLAYANSAVFEAAQITASTPNSGCEVQDGKLTGKVFEKGMQTIGHKIEKPPKVIAEMPFWCRDILDGWAQKGCTTVFDAGLGMIGGEGDILLARAATEVAAPVHYYGALAGHYYANNHQDKYLRPYSVGNVNVQAIKFWTDGSTQGFTAALSEPYQQPIQPVNGVYGELIYANAGALVADMEPWAKKGFQLMVHANGDAAVDQTILAYQQLASNGSLSSGHPGMNRIEHFTVVGAKQIADAQQLGLGISHTIGHVNYWGETFVNYVLNEPQAGAIDPCAQEEKVGLVWSMNSDSCVTDVNPLLYVKTAVTRQTVPNGHVYRPDLCVSVYAALRAVGYNPAKQIGIEDQTGTLEVGKWADLVVLASDPFTLSPQTGIDTIPIKGVWKEGVQTVSE